MAEQTLTEGERARILHMLSYPNWQSLAQAIFLGTPAGSQFFFLVNEAFDKIAPVARFSVRKDLQECECIEAQLSDARNRFKAVKIGNLELNHQEPEMLRKELMFWTTRLADDLGVIPDPYSNMIYSGISDGGGINSRVVG